MLDQVRGYQETEAYKKAYRKRTVWVEPLFARSAKTGMGCGGFVCVGCGGSIVRRLCVPLGKISSACSKGEAGDVVLAQPFAPWNIKLRLCLKAFLIRIRCEPLARRRIKQAVEKVLQMKREVPASDELENSGELLSEINGSGLLDSDAHDLASTRPWGEAVVGNVERVPGRIEGHGRREGQAGGNGGERAIGIDAHDLPEPTS